MPKKISRKWYRGGLAFACQACGRCCSGPEEGYVWVNNQNTKEMARVLGMDEANFRKKYVRRVSHRYSLIEKRPSKDCILLDETTGNGKGCLVYSVRPLQCRTWPFWKDNIRSSKAWNIAAQRCPGLDQGQWFSPDAIEAVTQGDLSAYDNGLDIADAAVDWIRTNLNKPQYRSAVEELYAMLDKQIASAAPSCDNCGKCCDFDRFGHRLYATTLEMLYFTWGLRQQEKDGYAPQAARLKGACPHQDKNGCATRRYRPAGCRIFFCHDLEPAFQQELTELVLTSLRRLHEDFAAVYYYADFRQWLTCLDR